MMMNRSKLAIVITAAGSSTRIGGNTKKEYLHYKNGTVLSNCAIAFLKALDKSEITNFIITCPSGRIEEAKNAVFSDLTLNNLLNANKNIEIQFVEGADTRQKSVFNALQCINKNCLFPDIVLIHDGARPFISEKIILDVLEAAKSYGASVPGITPIDTQKEIDENGFIIRHLVRKNLCAVQTPQGFQFSKLYNAHLQAFQEAEKTGKEYTDDTEIWGKFVGPVKTVPGDVNNIKITYPADLERL